MGLLINNYLFRRNNIQQHKKPLERYFEHSNSAKDGSKKRSNFEFHGKTHAKNKNESKNLKETYRFLYDWCWQ